MERACAHSTQDRRWPASEAAQRSFGRNVPGSTLAQFQVAHKNEPRGTTGPVSSAHRSRDALVPRWRAKGGMADDHGWTAKVDAVLKAVSR